MNFMRKNHITELLNQLLPWSSETLYFDTDQYFDTLLAEIDQAKKSIEIECYIFSVDSLGKRIIHNLLKAAQRGVEVRVMIDGFGSLNWGLEQIAKLTKVGIQVKIFRPLPWRLSLYKRVEVVSGFFTKLIYLTAKINKRNHRKLYVIDRKYAWSGSMNISASHLAHSLDGNNWFDTGVRITGAPVTELSNSFDDTWYNKAHYAISKKQLPFRTNNNFIKRQQKNAELIRLIRSAKIRIWIVSAYLVPSKRIVRALKKAKQRGVDVVLLISHQSDVTFFPLVSTIYYKEFLASGIKIFEYHKQIVHAKTILLDDLLLLGSSNLNHRSFLHDMELDILLKQPTSVQYLQQRFKQLISKAIRVDSSRLVNQSPYKALLGKILWLIRYWL